MSKINTSKLFIPFNAPLNPLDTPESTFGCRATAPDSCLNADTCVCAFTRKDCMCMKPSRLWKKQFYKLGGKDKK